MKYKRLFYSTPISLFYEKKLYFMVIPRWMSGKQLANRGPCKLKRDFGAKSTCSQAKKSNLIALNKIIYPIAIVVENLNNTFSNSLRKFRYISVWKSDEKLFIFASIISSSKILLFEKQYHAFDAVFHHQSCNFCRCYFVFC